jgi:CheY-like chemotaxis protein
MSGTVLIVDDDLCLLGGVEAALRRGGYSPLAASDPLEALAKSRSFTGEIQLLITDVKMPGMDGPTLAEQLLIERPRMRVLVMSADGERRPGLRFLRKPFQIKRLLEVVRDIMTGPHASAGNAAAEDDFRQALIAADLEAARRQHLLASRDFLDALHDWPSVPRPDGFLLVEQASKLRREAFHEYRRARKKLEEHLAKKGTPDRRGGTSPSSQPPSARSGASGE